jgi:hypothetical protein
LYFASDEFTVSSSKMYFLKQVLWTKVAFSHSTCTHFAED